MNSFSEPYFTNGYKETAGFHRFPSFFVSFSRFHSLQFWEEFLRLAKDSCKQQRTKIRLDTKHFSKFSWPWIRSTPGRHSRLLNTPIFVKPGHQKDLRKLASRFGDCLRNFKVTLFTQDSSRSGINVLIGSQGIGRNIYMKSRNLEANFLNSFWLPELITRIKALSLTSWRSLLNYI